MTSPPITHYENFPVASWLCPARLRPAVAAIYHFARTADDLADEGEQPAAQRLAALHACRQALHAASQPAPYPADAPYSAVMQPLQRAMQAHALPAQPLADLLTAFEHDVQHSASGHVYPNHAALLDYARYSANPVGRLMLHLYGVRDAAALQQSDAICSALQLFNFWQDVAVDVPRSRFYLPQDACSQHGVDPRAPQQASPAAVTALMHDLLDQADRLMQQGRPLPAQVRRKAGRMAAWELRLVMQGGLRIGAKTRALGGRIATQRLRLGTWDALPLWYASLRNNSR